MEREKLRVKPDTIRSRIMLEVASELVGRPDVFATRQATVLLQRQGSRQPSLRLAGSDATGELERVANREVDLAIINPAVVLTLAARGVSPFRGPLPLHTIGVIPSLDQLVVAVRPDAGLETVEDLVRVPQPFRLSLRGQRDHSLHVVTDHVLQAAGTSLADLRAAGGEVHYDEGMPGWGRMDKFTAGERDALIDEGAGTWVDLALDAGMRILPFGEETLSRLASWGYRRAWLRRAEYPALTEDIPTVDFSGWPIYVHQDADDELVTLVCEALTTRQDRIAIQDGTPLPLGEMVTDAEGAPLDVPLHKAARAYWEGLGLLDGA